MKILIDEGPAWLLGTWKPEPISNVRGHVRQMTGILQTQHFN